MDKIIPWNKNKKGVYTVKTLEKMRQSAIKRGIARYIINKSADLRRGKPLGDNQKENISKSMLGKNKGNSPWNKGKTGFIYSQDRINKIKEKRAIQVLPFENTSIELNFCKELDKNNIFYKKHHSLLGRPDIFIEPNICIFIDGNYWHANPKRYKENSLIFKTKEGKKILAKNIWEKDKRINDYLQNKGYNILRFFEDDINNNINKCIKQTLEVIENAR